MNYLSLFSGMEAAHLAWSPLGWTCIAVAEIDPNACALLGHRLNASQPKYLPVHVPVLIEETGEWSTDPYPRKAYAHLPPFGTPGTLPNLGDVSQATADDIAALGHIDAVIGGSPCQDLSVAGKRAGLSGARSGLFHEQLRIFDAARSFCGARWLVWENVPGAFSSNAGRDFAVVVGALAGCELNVPRDGWGTEGVALGDNGLVEWALLDSQWFGVAQRRRRVFAVLDTGDWASRSPVLLECESLRGDSPPRRETGEGVAGTISARTQGGGGLGIDFECDGGLIPEVAGCLTNSGGHAYPGTTVQDAMAGGFMIPEGAHIVRADGSDASEDGTGRGTPLVPCRAYGIRTANTSSNGWGIQEETSHTLDAAGPPAIAFDCKASGQAGFGVGDIASTMRSMGHADSHQNGGGHLAVAVMEPYTLAIRGRGDDSVLEYRQDGTANALLTPSGGRAGINVGAVAIGCDTYNGALTGDVAATLGTQSGDGLSSGPSVLQAMQVRRLTPIECERLQAAPDDWTLVPNAKGKPMADGPRYKMLGNSFTATVIRWIGRRIEAATIESARSAIQEAA